MVYMQFPSELTEEEQNLQGKYAKLKKKKKALQILKAPKQEPEKPVTPKRPAEARDAREVAKKLIKSGVITAIPKQQKQPEHGFKRPRGQEQRKPLADKVSGYLPFSSVQNDEGPDNPENKPPRIKNLYENARGREREERPPAEREKPEKPRTGNTIYVTGHKITEEFLRKHFASIGDIAFISMELEKNRGFITFEDVKCAERAISEMDGSMVSGIQLTVSLARRQPSLSRIASGGVSSGTVVGGSGSATTPSSEVSSSAAWSTISASQSQKGSHRDRREMVSYEDMDIF